VFVDPALKSPVDLTAMRDPRHINYKHYPSLYLAERSEFRLHLVESEARFIHPSLRNDSILDFFEKHANSLGRSPTPHENLTPAEPR
jgi:hypothetical protein